MAWRTTLARMLADQNPNSYRYDEAATILRQLGFEMPKTSTKGSHRKWRRRLPDGTTIVIGLVDSGSGTLKPWQIRDMVRQLRDHALIPNEPE